MNKKNRRKEKNWRNPYRRHGGIITYVITCCAHNDFSVANPPHRFFSTVAKDTTTFPLFLTSLSWTWKPNIPTSNMCSYRSHAACTAYTNLIFYIKVVAMLHRYSLFLHIPVLYVYIIKVLWIEWVSMKGNHFFQLWRISIPFWK